MMFALLGALALLTAASDSSVDDKTFHSCPDGWEVGSTDGWEVGSTDGWEVGSLCRDKDGVTWRFDGKGWVIDEREW